jgi:hypothetical protein
LLSKRRRTQQIQYSLLYVSCAGSAAAACVRCVGSAVKALRSGQRHDPDVHGRGSGYGSSLTFRATRYAAVLVAPPSATRARPSAHPGPVSTSALCRSRRTGCDGAAATICPWSQPRPQGVRPLEPLQPDHPPRGLFQHTISRFPLKARARAGLSVAGVNRRAHGVHITALMLTQVTPIHCVAMLHTRHATEVRS